VKTMRSFKDTFAVMVTSRSIGLVDQYCDAETSVYYEWNWLWKTRPVTIHQTWSGRLTCFVVLPFCSVLTSAL
jgi:hypothetical protein